MTRLVTMPEWQGAGVGSKFLNFMAQYALEGKAKFNRKAHAYFHTSHPQLCGYLRHSKKWVQVSGELFRKEGCKQLAEKKRHTRVKNGKLNPNAPVGHYGGHFRAVQGFKYIGDMGEEKK